MLEMADTERMTGTVVRLFLNKGFGFVRGQDNVSRFMHARDLKDPSEFDRLHEGTGVTFVSRDFSDRDVGGNGLRAVEVEVIPK
jgi:cold shock CspA family protein